MQLAIDLAPIRARARSRGQLIRVLATLDELGRLRARAPFDPETCLHAVERAERELARYLKGRKRPPWADDLVRGLDDAKRELAPLAAAQRARL